MTLASAHGTIQDNAHGTIQDIAHGKIRGNAHGTIQGNAHCTLQDSCLEIEKLCLDSKLWNVHERANVIFSPHAARGRLEGDENIFSREKD